MRGLITTAVAFGVLLSAAGCAGGVTTAQKEAADALAAACAREVEDPEFRFITVNEASVAITVSDKAQKLINVMSESDNVTEDMAKEDFMKGAGLALGLLTDMKCLAEEAGTPTSEDGDPKPGEFPSWTVVLDDAGYPTFTSTIVS